MVTIRLSLESAEIEWAPFAAVLLTDHPALMS